METINELDEDATVAPCGGDTPCIQAGDYLLELSLDWIVLRASENIHHLLGESHVTLIEEPLGRFVHSQALHDLRNLFSRLSGTTGIGRAYAVRLTDDPDFVDVAFQLVGGRVLLEAVPSLGSFGECFGTVGGLIAGLANIRGQALLDAGARRMRALTGYDRVTLLLRGEKATSDRSGVPFRPGANASLSDDLPRLVPDNAASAIAVFPRLDKDATIRAALLKAPSTGQKGELSDRGFAATMRIPIRRDGESVGEFRLAHTTQRAPNFELHAAAELFAQVFAMQLEIDDLRNG